MDDLSLVVEGYSFNYEYDSKKLKDIDNISNGCLLYAIIFARDIWTIYVHKYDQNEIINIEINKNKTFGELRKIVCKKFDCSIDNTILVGRIEYGSHYYSKKLKDIDDFFDGYTFYLIEGILGGAKTKY